MPRAPSAVGRHTVRVAYEMLGSAADAEDVMQETCLRWADLCEDGQSEVQNPRAYLVRIVTRQAPNRLRTLARRREDYVGEWLPEPRLLHGIHGYAAMTRPMPAGHAVQAGITRAA
ncbi:Sigma-70 region 2 [Pedococcus cremeus]|uniref:Sigma-70 region 2 n=1 Tax=Pedococcus cremeus TaxID=587636 RepID=A0A1H9XQJ3_9MICO|nr:Sigma-70 region 2 [Pedococcus cremeus]